MKHMKQFLSLLSLGFTAAASGGSAAEIPFKAQTIDGKVAIGYGLAIGDVDGDGKPDILLADKTEIVWYDNPAWTRRVIARNLTARDNVCIAARDLDGDGKVEVAVGAMWNPGETENVEQSGSIHILQRPGEGDGLWISRRLPHEPTVHRMHWRKADDGFELLVAPLHGRGNVRGVGDPVKVLGYARPADPMRDDWPTRVADDKLHMTHNFDLRPGNEDVIVGGFEGVNVNGEPVLTNADGSRGVGEVRAMRKGYATIEPMHGTDVVVYEQAGDGWRRTVLASDFQQGHALAVGDLRGDGGEQVVAGWRNRNADRKVGIKLFTPGPDGWASQWIDDDGMACEDLKLADLDADGDLDIVAAGRATKNVKIYWNER